jgi:hypothetical protein
MARPLKLIPGVALQEFTATDRLDFDLLPLDGVRREVGASYVVKADDHRTWIIFTSSTPVIVTAPADSQENVPIGTVVNLVRGDGDVEIQPSGGAVIRALFDITYLPGPWGTGKLVKIGPDEWLFITFILTY